MLLQVRNVIVSIWPLSSKYLRILKGRDMWPMISYCAGLLSELLKPGCCLDLKQKSLRQLLLCTSSSDVCCYWYFVLCVSLGHATDRQWNYFKYDCFFSGGDRLDTGWLLSLVVHHASCWGQLFLTVAVGCWACSRDGDKDLCGSNKRNLFFFFPLLHSLLFTSAASFPPEWRL